MKKFLIKISFFILPILVFLGFFELGLRSIPNNYSYKNKILKTNYQGVILGNSHSYRGVLAENISFKTVNLSNVSQSVDIDLLWLKEAIKYNDLDFIILNFSIPTLFGKLDEGTENWRVRYYNIYTDLWLSYGINNNLELANNESLDNFQTLYKYFIQKQKVNSVTCDSLGSYPLDVFTENINEQSITSAKRHTKKPVHFHKRNLTYLNEIIGITENNNIQVFMVTLPAYSTYRESLNVEHKILFYEIGTKLSLQQNVVWINHFYDEEFDQSLFKDGDHLNLLGAQKFTEILNKELLNYFKHKNDQRN